VIATVTSVPIGGALKFTNPLDGSTGYLMQPSAGTFLGYSAVCSHQGCIVDYVPDAEMFLCPCHGANYDAQGNVTRGPATKSLQAISVAVQGDNVVLLPG
jgi:thiosulfate dehydrogenase [quinone] large subunit